MFPKAKIIYLQMKNMVALTYTHDNGVNSKPTSFRLSQSSFKLLAIEWDRNYCRVFSWSTELVNQF